MAAHLVFGLLWSVNLAWAATPGEIQNYFKTQLSSSSEVVLSSSQAYITEIKQRWNAYDPPSFVVGVKPATANDVAIIVSSKNILFTSTSVLTPVRRSVTLQATASHSWEQVAAMVIPQLLAP